MSIREVPKRVKEHVKEHKELYIGISLGVGLAGITATIMRSNIARGAMDADGVRGAPIDIASLSFGNRGTINITTVLDREGRGHPGWPCRNLETGRIFLSQQEAANYFDIPKSVLSGHITGKFPDADGLHFERVNLAAA